MLLRSKRIQKLDGKRVKPNKLIKKATFNSNNSISPKYGYAPQEIETKSLDKDSGKNFQEIYDFHRLWKFKENRLRNEKYAETLDSMKKTKTTCFERQGESFSFSRTFKEERRAWKVV